MFVCLSIYLLAFTNSLFISQLIYIYIYKLFHSLKKENKKTEETDSQFRLFNKRIYVSYF